VGLADGLADGAADVTDASVPGERLLDLVGIMNRLRISCPWDSQQTHVSLLRYLLEEAYEAADAIEAGDDAAMREELGDVLFQVLFHARVAAERTAAEGGFTIDDVAETLAAKLIRRHPHVFGSVTVSSADEVNANWEAIKMAERAAKTEPGDAAPSVLDGVPFGQPALSLAAQLQRRAARAGFTVADEAPGEARESGEPRESAESHEPAESVEAADSAESVEAAFGAELMGVVARARAAGVDPELALRSAAKRFADQVRAREHSDAWER
jgi:XTP/dITP diphosphohydrolase